MQWYNYQRAVNIAMGLARIGDGLIAVFSLGTYNPGWPLSLSRYIALNRAN